MKIPVKVVPGRSCKGCTLCCKLLEIGELQKPRGVWCGHCDQRSGCKIHGRHPDECRLFYCGYRTNAELDERWHPAKCKILLAYDETNAPRLIAYVDPSRPGAWREEPFYSQIKRWAVAAAAAKGQVIVWQGRTAFAVLPDRDKELGEIRSDQLVIISQKAGPQGAVFDALVVDRDDPLARSLPGNATPPGA